MENKNPCEGCKYDRYSPTEYCPSCELFLKAAAYHSRTKFETSQIDNQMTNNEAILRILDHIRIHSIKEPQAIFINEALYIGVRALQREEDKKQGCMYCHSMYDLEDGDILEPSIYIQGDKLIALRYDEKNSEATIRFCPMCGCEIKKEGK
jgi:hypothetical protein